jgi:DNA-binding transcriptional MerR regulator
MDDTPSTPLPRMLLRHELAALSGVNAETLRFYEKSGVLTPTRCAKGYRLYGEDDLKRLKLIQRAVGLGFGLDDIKGWLAGDVENLRAGLEAIEKKALDLEKLRKNLKKRWKAGA